MSTLARSGKYHIPKGAQLHLEKGGMRSFFISLPAMTFFCRIGGFDREQGGPYATGVLSFFLF